MRLKFLVGAFFALLVLGALPAADAQVTKKLFLPLVAREPTWTPTPTPIPQDVHIQYRAFVQDLGWQPWQNEGGDAGTTGQARRIEAFEMRIVQGPPGVHIR